MFLVLHYNLNWRAVRPPYQRVSSRLNGVMMVKSEVEAVLWWQSCWCWWWWWWGRRGAERRACWGEGVSGGRRLLYFETSRHRRKAGCSLETIATCCFLPVFSPLLRGLFLTYTHTTSQYLYLTACHTCLIHTTPNIPTYTLHTRQPTIPTIAIPWSLPYRKASYVALPYHTAYHTTHCTVKKYYHTIITLSLHHTSHCTLRTTKHSHHTWPLHNT